MDRVKIQTVKRLITKDGKFPCPNVTHIGQELRTLPETLTQYDVINPLNNQIEKKVCMNLADENGKDTGQWILIECLFD